MPPIHPRHVPTGYTLTSTPGIPTRARDPNQATYNPAQTALYNAPIDNAVDTRKRADVQGFVYHDVEIGSAHSAHIYSNGGHDWVDSDPSSSHRATQMDHDNRVTYHASHQLRGTKRTEFDVYKKIISRITGLLCTL